jgi:hypothetical protein
MAVTMLDVVRFPMQKGPGRIKEQLGEAIFGKPGRQARVKSACIQVNFEDFETRGTVGPVDPFRYFPGERPVPKAPRRKASCRRDQPCGDDRQDRDRRDRGPYKKR